METSCWLGVGYMGIGDPITAARVGFWISLYVCKVIMSEVKYFTEQSGLDHWGWLD